MNNTLDSFQKIVAVLEYKLVTSLAFNRYQSTSFPSIIALSQALFPLTSTEMVYKRR